MLNAKRFRKEMLGWARLFAGRDSELEKPGFRAIS